MKWRHTALPYAHATSPQRNGTCTSPDAEIGGRDAAYTTPRYASQPRGATADDDTDADADDDENVDDDDDGGVAFVAGGTGGSSSRAVSASMEPNRPASFAFTAAV
jgi:hypothetical protein